MKRIRILLCLLVLLPLTNAFAHEGHAHDKSRPQDQNAIKRLVRDFSKSWGRHDATQMANSWAGDGDLIDPSGSEARGKNEIESLLARQHGGELKGSKISFEVESLRFLSENHAFVDAKAVISGLKIGNKKHPNVSHHVAFVAQKIGSGWKFLSVRPYAFAGDMAPSLGEHMCKKGGSHGECAKMRKDCGDKFCPKDGSCKKCAEMKKDRSKKHGKDFCPKEGGKKCCEGHYGKCE